jgi:2-dehydropantoate 2-reductase
MESVLIAGSGALACLFAARLAPHARVTMLGTWPEGIAALQSSGVVLEEGDEQRSFKISATDDPRSCEKHRYALVLVKSWQTQRAADQLRDCLTADGVALTLQNGYGNLEILQETLGSGHAALGVTTTGATLLSPGHVRAGGKGPIHLVPQKKLEPLLSLFQAAGFEIARSDDLDSLVWGKLVINAGINPLTALLGIPNGQLLAQPQAKDLMAAAAQEAAAVAAALGVRLPYDDPVESVSDVARKTSTNHSSMLQDMRRGAPTEIEAISGAIARIGDREGVQTPVNAILRKLVLAAVSIKKGNPS